MLKVATLAALVATAGAATAGTKIGPADTDGKPSGYSADPTFSADFSTATLSETLAAWDTSFDDWIGLAPAIINTDSAPSATNTPTVAAVSGAGVELSMVAMPDKDGKTWTHPQFEANCDCDYKYLQTGILVSKNAYGQGFYEAVMKGSSDTNPFMSAFWLQGEKGEINVVEFVNKMVGNNDEETAWNNYHCFDRTDDQGDTTTDDKYDYTPNTMTMLANSGDANHFTALQTYAVNYVGETVTFYVNGKKIRSASASCLVGQNMRVIFSLETNPTLDGDAANKPNTNPEDFIAQGADNKLVVKEFNYWQHMPLEAYDAAVAGAKGKWKGGSGQYKGVASGEAEKATTKEACAALCSSTNPAHHSAQGSVNDECFGFSFKERGTSTGCELHTEAAFGGGFYQNGNTADWDCYVKKAADVPAPTGALADYDAAVDGRKGKYKKGAGQYMGGIVAASAEACAVLCSSAAHTSKCHAFSFGNQKCDMHTAEGASGTYSASSWAFYKKTAAPAPPVVADGDLTQYDNALVGRKGRWKSATGQLKGGLDAATPAACAALCSAEPDTPETAKCFAFSHKASTSTCDLHTAIGAEGTYGAGAWNFYKRKPAGTPVDVGGVLAKYDAGVDGKQGKYLKGTGSHPTDAQYSAAAMADAAGCAAVCSAAEHDAACMGFSFNAAKQYKCQLYTAAGVKSLRNGNGFTLYMKKSTAAVPDVSSGGGIEVFAAPVADAKGRYKKGTGNYPNDSAQDAVKTAEACATLCNSAAHAAGRAQKAGETCNGAGKCGCYGFSFLPTAGSERCELHSEVGANYNLYKAAATAGWGFYKLK